MNGPLIAGACFSHGVSDVSMAGSTGPTLVMGGPWHSSHAALRDLSHIRSVIVRERGMQLPWEALDVARMLGDLPGVVHVDIEYEIVGDLGWIDALPRLQHLGVRCSKVRKKGVPSNPLTELTSLDISGHEALVALVRDSVARLAVADCKAADLFGLAPTALVSLKLTRARQLVDLSALQTLVHLREVDIYSAPKLVDASPVLQGAAETVRLASCRDLRLDTINGVNPHLRSLALVDCGDVGSITWLRVATELASIQLSGTSVADGKLAFLSELPALSDIRIEHKKHNDFNFPMPTW